MVNVNKVIIAVLRAEKTQREARRLVYQAAHGYNPTTEMIVNCTIDDNTDDLEHFGDMEMAEYQHSPFLDTFTNNLTKDIHRYINLATWKIWSSDVVRSGTTWIELFTRFDTHGFRSTTSVQSKEADSHHRFLRRTSREKRRHGNITSPAARASCTRPSLALELQTFKAIFKKIVRQYLPEKAQHLFTSSTAQADKRLRNLGLNTHMAAIAGILDATTDHLGNQIVEQAILKQRTSMPAKKLKAMIDTNNYNNDIKRGTTQGMYENIKTTASQLDYKMPIRWNRKYRLPEQQAHRTQGDTEDTDDPHTRYLLCMKCGHKIDAKHKQLAVKDGFRIINCPQCKWRGRAQHLNCECGKRWYLCGKHRPDPPTHQSKKPPKTTTPRRPRNDKTLRSNRAAPTIRGTDTTDRIRRRRRPKKNLHAYHPEGSPKISPEYAASLLSRWKRRKQEARSFDIPDSGGEAWGSRAPCNIPRNIAPKNSPSSFQQEVFDPTSSTSVVLRPWPGPPYSGPEVSLPTIVAYSGRLPLDLAAPGRLPNVKKDGPNTPTASKACPNSKGRAGSAYDGEATTRAITRTNEVDSMPPAKRACTKTNRPSTMA